MTMTRKDDEAAAFYEVESNRETQGPGQRKRTFIFESPDLEGRSDPLRLRPPGGGAYMLYSSMLPLDKDGLPGPTFTTGEVAKIFFGRRRWWLQMHDFVLDGALIEPRRNEHGVRQYTLVDIERMGYALAQAGEIGGERLISILSIVRHVAILNGVHL